MNDYAIPANQNELPLPEIRLSNKRLRVVVADDHNAFRRCLTQLLQGTPGIEVVGSASDGAEAVELVGRFRPDFVIMDVSMPVLNGIQATLRIMTEYPDVQIIALSMHADREMAAQMLAAGAVCYLTKSGSIEELLAAIHVAQAA
jgi:two-component system, NarL family, response regulator NreC